MSCVPVARLLITSLSCAALLLALSLPASAATRAPCSGKKGGVDRCENGKFICKDGSKSASKKVCEKTG
jgi:colicin import membrane protein